MYPLKSIVDYLLTGVGRIPAPDRADALCSVFTGLLPGLSEPEIATAREQVIAHFWMQPDVATPVLDLIEGHVALRSLLSTNEDDGTMPDARCEI